MLNRVWSFLKVEENQKLLGLIGGGLVVAAGGLWALFTFYVDHLKPSPPPPQSIEVHNGNVIGSGPNATFNAPVTVNPDAKEVVAPISERLDKLAAQQKELAAQVAHDKGVPVEPLLSVLVKLGEKGVQETDVPKRLDAAADELIKLRAEVEQFQHGPPALAAIAQEAQTLIDKGDLDGARHALVRGREAARAQRTDASRDEAKFLALDARVDDLQLAYGSAAAKYAEAASLVAPFDTKQQWVFLSNQARELSKQGDEFGDYATVAEAIDLYHRCLALAPRSDRPLDWAMTQNNLGNALATLGGRESGTAPLEEAVAAFREALQELTRERLPLVWAATQVSLGNALETLGERESGTARLNEAVAAFHAALEVRTRERVPLDWAMTQVNLGNALERLGERDGGTARLDEAAAAYREALQERTRERVPLQWAGTQMGLGNALRALGERESGTARLEAAVAAAREALQEYTRERAPLGWAVAEHYLGDALRILGERESGTARLTEAVAAYREALQERTRARVPLKWANSTGGQGVALMLLAERRGDAKMAKLAVQ
jgi:tetratricopeptide (TPR) repeat protein